MGEVDPEAQAIPGIYKKFLIVSVWWKAHGGTDGVNELSSGDELCPLCGDCNLEVLCAHLCSIGLDAKACKLGKDFFA